MMTVIKFVGRWGAVCGLLLLGGVLSGCKSEAASDSRFLDLPSVGGNPGPSSTSAPNASVTAPARAPTGASITPGGGTARSHNNEGADWLDVGHALVVTYADLPYLQPPQDVRIREDGTITLLQNLTFKAAGRTIRDLEHEIHDTYVPAYFKNLTVTVSHKENTQFYYVDGEVKRPDRQIYISRMTVLRAIASANGFTDFARKKAVELTRTDGRKELINCIKAQKDPKLDVEVFPGDKIYVPRRNPIW